ncbi:MAG: sensor histidine kinase [Coprobacillaceae bacterium]
MRKNIFTIFLQYLYHLKKVIIALVLFTSLYSFMAYLYNYSMSAILYTFIITYFILLVICFIHFHFYYQKHKKLKHIENHIDISLDDLPSPSSLIEKDYQDLLHTLLKKHQMAINSHNNYQQELFDYYSLWIHQIKTPISAMKILLDTEQYNNDKLLELQRIEQYVEMVLQYLRLESMSSDLVIKEYDLDKILQDSIKKQASFFIHKKISLQYKPVNTHVITDAKWFRLVIEQILTNSLKYTNSGTITIYIWILILLGH